MEKRGLRAQVTIFIIIGVLIFLGVAITMLFFVKDNSVVRQFINRNSVSSEVMPVYESVDSCIRQRVVDALRIVGLQGGYVNLPKDYVVTSVSNVGYGYYLGKNTLPSKVKIQNELSNYVLLSIPFCMVMDDINDYDISIGDLSVKTKINKYDVNFNIKFPVSLLKDNNTYKLGEEYYYNIPIKLGDMIDLSNSIIAKEKDGNIPIGFLTETKYDTMVLYNDDFDVVYAIVDLSNETKINDLGYSFLFANKLRGENEIQ